jgi:nucleotide-binding universal stress UspA family protein
MILICYDGSPDAKAAIERGGELLKGQPAIVLTVWQPFVEVLSHTATFGIGAAMFDVTSIDEASRNGAVAQAEEGARIAREAGLDAEPRTASQRTTAAEAILSEADAIGASAIVIGSRGLTGLRSLLLGSVSHGVIQHADRAVIVVPSPEVGASRRRARREAREDERPG